MQCPVCPPSSSPLRETWLDSLAVCACSRCEGLGLSSEAIRSTGLEAAHQGLLRLLDDDGGRAPGRCARRGHPIAPGQLKCRTCGGEAARCPVCASALASLELGPSTIELCPSCGGVWLDRGELHAFEAASTWSIGAPRSAAPAGGGDPWLAPGHLRGSHEGPRPTSRRPFACRHCETALALEEAFASDGEVYCARCRPDGAVGAHELPRDTRWDADGVRPTPRGGLVTILRGLFGGR